MPSTSINKSSFPAFQQIDDEDGFEIIADPKDQVEVIGSDYEDAEWDHCEIPLKKISEKTENKGKIPASASSVFTLKEQHKSTKKETAQEKFRKQVAAAIKHLEPETKV
ncbi:hypothetical protein ACLX1H_000844 [Fusarium chlamydosporum]